MQVWQGEERNQRFFGREEQRKRLATSCSLAFAFVIVIAVVSPRFTVSRKIVAAAETVAKTVAETVATQGNGNGPTAYKLMRKRLT